MSLGSVQGWAQSLRSAIKETNAEWVLEKKSVSPKSELCEKFKNLHSVLKKAETEGKTQADVDLIIDGINLATSVRNKFHIVEKDDTTWTITRVWFRFCGLFNGNTYVYIKGGPSNFDALRARVKTLCENMPQPSPSVPLRQPPSMQPVVSAPVKMPVPVTPEPEAIKPVIQMPASESRPAPEQASAGWKLLSLFKKTAEPPKLTPEQQLQKLCLTEKEANKKLAIAKRWVDPLNNGEFDVENIYAIVKRGKNFVLKRLVGEAPIEIGLPGGVVRVGNEEFRSFENLLYRLKWVYVDASKVEEEQKKLKVLFNNIKTFSSQKEAEDKLAELTPLLKVGEAIYCVITNHENGQHTHVSGVVNETGKPDSYTVPICHDMFIRLPGALRENVQPMKREDLMPHAGKVQTLFMDDNDFRALENRKAK